MKLGELYESYTTPHTEFLRLYQQSNLMECETLDETKQKVKQIFLEADNYANENKLEYRYFDLAKAPLWHEIEIEPEHFILKGFDAYINVDLKESIEDIKPFVSIQNDNVDQLSKEQRIDIDEGFINSLNELQRAIFSEALERIEKQTVDKLQKVWSLEKQRIDKWVKTSKIKLKGEL